MFSASMQYIDIGNIKATSVIQPIPAASAPTTAKILTLLTVLKAHINPGVFMYSLKEWTEGAVTGAVATAVGSNRDKALVSFSYVDAGGETQFGVMWLPNPDLAHFELVEGVGYRLLPASKVLLETSMSTASGLTIKITEGRLEYKEREAGNGSKNASCLRFEDSVGNMDYMAFGLATDSAALIAFGGALNTDGMTQSKLEVSQFLEQTDVMCDPTVAPGIPAAGDWDCVETRAILNFAYVAGGKKKHMKLMLPGIKQADCEYKTGKKGWKVKKVVGDGVATALTGFFGAPQRTLRFVGSRLDGVDLQNQ